MISDSSIRSKEDKWEHAWVAFENRNLSFAREAAGEYYHKVPMDLVLSFKIDSGSVKHDILITKTDGQKITLRCPNSDEMKKWLFTFQKSVALVYSHLVGAASDGAKSTYGSLINTGSGLQGIPERRGFDMLDQDSTPSKRRSSVDDGKDRIDVFSSHLMKVTPSDAQRAIHGIESGIAMSNDYLVRPTPAFGRMASIKPDASMPMQTNALSGSDSSFGIMQKRRNSLTDNDSGAADRYMPMGAGAGGGGGSLSRAVESSNNLLLHRSSPREYSTAQLKIGIDVVQLNQQKQQAEAAQRNSYYNSMAASSPAIPIHMNDSPYGGGDTLLADGTLRQSFEAQKVAGSYEDSNLGMLAKAVEALDSRDPSSDLDSVESMSDCGDASLGDDGGDMMFDLEESNGSQNVSPKVSRDSISPSDNKGLRSGDKGLSSPSGVSTGSKSKKDKDKRTRSTDGAISPASFLSNLRISGDDNSQSAINALSAAFEAGPPKPALSWYCGSCSKLGPRNSNEDRFVAINDLNTFKVPPSTAEAAGTSSGTRQNKVVSPGFSSQAEVMAKGSSVGYYAVYDGHCGHQAAQFLQDELHSRIFKHPLFAENIQKAMMESCAKADTDFLDLCAAKRIYCGTTCLGMFLCNNQMVFFNIGDCLAVKGLRDGTAKELTNPHKPGRADEEARIKAANGWITEEKELYMGRLHRMDLSDPVVRDKAQKVSWVTIHRVCGELAVSRSIGDPDYKRFVPNEKVDALFNWPAGHKESFAADLVIPTPEITTFDITVEDEFVIIASDGLWDVVSSEEAATLVKECFKEKFTPAEAAEELCELALKLGSSDNVTIVIVKFSHPQ